MNQTLTSSEPIQFSPVEIDESYAKKWNEGSRDFIMLSRNGQPLRNTLYRIGRLGKPKLGQDKYFMLLKYSEAFYPDHIIKMSRESKYGNPNQTANHLQSNWCILDSEGNEKIEIKDSIKYPSLVKDSCIYSIGNEYYNIETGKLYCESYVAMTSGKYLFLKNSYDKDESKRGVLKIDKETGMWELYPA